jgi:hypothetical protein
VSLVFSVTAVLFAIANVNILGNSAVDGNELACNMKEWTLILPYFILVQFFLLLNSRLLCHHQC